MKINEVSAKQMWMNLIIIAAIPTFRLFGPMTIDIAGNGAPFSYILTFLLCIPLLGAYGYIANRQKGKPFTEINVRLFGKFAGGIVNSVYAIWALFLAAFYAGQFGERISGTLFYDTNMVVFVLLLLFTVSYAVKKGAATLARAGTILAYMILATLFLFSLILFRDVRMENFLPLSSRDVVPTIKGVLPGLSVTAFLPLFFVFGKGTTKRVPFFSHGLKSLAILAVATLLIVALPLGIFGKEMMGKLTIPFYAAIRNMVVFDSLERLEVIVIALLLMSDFIIVAMFTMAAVRMIDEIFETENESRFIDIIIFGIFMGAMLTAVGEFKIEPFVSRFIMPVNLAFGILLPIAWLVAGMVRKLPKSTVEST